MPLPKKEDFYSHLNMGDITDADYAHTKRVCKDVEINNLGEYQNLYFQSKLLADIFENFRNMCLEIYGPDPSKFIDSKTSDPHILLINVTDKINLKKSDKYVALSNLSIYYIWKNIKKSYKNNKFKISALTWNEEFELPHGSYSVSDIQDHFEYI